MLDQLRHLAEEKGQQQCADVRSVHIGVRHDDDAVITQLWKVELAAADAAAQRGDQVPTSLDDSILSNRAFLDVEDFAAQRQNRLRAAVAALFGRAPGGVALDEVELGHGRVFFLAVGELAGQTRRCPAHPCGGSSRGPCAPLPGAAASIILVTTPLASWDARRGRRRKLAEFLLDRGFDLAGYQLVLGLRGELWIRHLDGDYCGQAFSSIIPSS